MWGIIILGGGVGGCSAAHRLIMGGYKGSILLIERNEQLGGIARSSVVSHENPTQGRTGLPTEYSWRVGGSDYAVCHSIWKDIPDKHLTVEENWVPVRDKYWMTTKQTDFRVDSTTSSLWAYVSGFRSQISCREAYHLVNRFLYALTCSTERRNQELSNVEWRRFLSPVPEAADPYVVRAIAPILGVDFYSASASAVM